MLIRMIAVLSVCGVLGACGATQTRTTDRSLTRDCSCAACSCASCEGGDCTEGCCADGACCLKKDGQGCCQDGQCVGCQRRASEGGGATLTSYTDEPVGGSEAVLFVDGMACPMCATNVDLKLRELAGVGDAKVNLELGSVLVTFAGETRPTGAQLAKVVDDSGFTLSKIVVR